MNDLKLLIKKAVTMKYYNIILPEGDLPVYVDVDPGDRTKLFLYSSLAGYCKTRVVMISVENVGGARIAEYCLDFFCSHYQAGFTESK